MKTISVVGAAVVWILVSFAAPLAGSAQEAPAVDPQADRLLKQMSDYLASRKQLTVQAQASYETLLDSGQKLMFVNSVEVLLKRPDRLYVHRRGMLRDQELFYDGKTFTLFGRRAKRYATTPVPATIDQTLDYATEELGLTASGSDLFYSDVYGGLMADVLSGIYIGRTEINGVPCHQLAFRGTEVDWQIWIADGEKPLPWKYVITSKWTTGAPQYTLNVRKWDTATEIAEKRFHFKAPEGVERIDFLPQAWAKSAKKQLKKELQQ